MEALSLIFAIKKVVVAIDDAARSYNDAHGTLAAIRSQVNLVDASTAQLQAWFDKADKASKRPVSRGLDEAVSVIESMVVKLEIDLKRTIAAAEPSGISDISGSNLEAQLRERLADIREGVSLAHFTLVVCRCREDQKRLKCVEELHIASSTLRRALRCSRQQERAVVITEGANRAGAASPDFKAFAAEIMFIERARDTDIIQPVGDASETQMSQESRAPAALRVPRSSPSSPSMHQETSEIQELPNEADQAPSGSRTRTTSVDQQYPPRSLGKTKANNPESLIIPSREEESGPYAPRPSHMSPSEATSPNAKTGEASSSGRRNISRKPIFSMASTMVPTSPTLDAETLPPEKTGFHNPNGQAPTAGSSSGRTPSGVSVRRTSDLKLGTLEEDSDDLPPAYQEEVRSPPPPTLPARPTQREDIPDINQTDEDGRPYLLKTVQENLIPIVQVLIERGVNLDAVDSRTRRTAIMEAARLAREEVAELLLNGGCRLDPVDGEGNTVLHHAVYGGSVKILKQIISTEQIDVNSRGQAGRAPIHLASELGKIHMVSALIHGRADYNLKDEVQRTPLHIGAARGYAQLCEFLLEEGAALETYDRDGKTPLELAASTDRSSLVDVLLAGITSTSIDPSLIRGFFEAVKIGNVRMAQAFLAKGIKLKKMKEGWRAGAYAAQSGNLDMLRLVIENKANLKDRSPDGWNPLHFAASMGHTAMVQRLLEEKVSPKTTTKNRNETPLHLAVANGHSNTAELLMDTKSTDIQASDVDQNQPIHHAARLGLSSIAQALLAKKVKPNVENKYGWRPIHLAAAYGHVTLAADLIGHGVSVEEKLGGSSYKASKHTHEALRRGYAAEARWPHPAGRPLSIAIEFGQDGVARMLLAHGAKVDGMDIHGWRPLHHAAFACNPEMVETLLQRGANPHATTNDNNTPLALGFRTAGLDVVQPQKEQVRRLLQEAMLHTRPLKFDALRRGISFGGNSASQRNLVWNTAEMAAALLARNGPFALGEGEEVVTPDGQSAHGPAPSTNTADDSESLSLGSSTPDFVRVSPLQSAFKRPSLSPSSPTDTSLRESISGQPLPARPVARATMTAELPAQQSIHRRMAELDGPEISELTGTSRVVELGTAMPIPGSASAPVAELPAEKN